MLTLSKLHNLAQLLSCRMHQKRQKNDCRKFALSSLSLCHATAKGRSWKLSHRHTTTFLVLCKYIKSLNKIICCILGLVRTCLPISTIFSTTSRDLIQSCVHTQRDILKFKNSLFWFPVAVHKPLSTKIWQGVATPCQIRSQSVQWFWAKKQKRSF